MAGDEGAGVTVVGGGCGGLAGGCDGGAVLGEIPAASAGMTELEGQE